MSNPTPITIEVCIGTPECAAAAHAGGADRLEVCDDLQVGGLTPPLTLIEQIQEEMELPIMAMVRPRPGNFVYSKSELESMLRTIETLKSARVMGVVFGVLTRDGHIDQDACHMLLAAARPLSVTFHRAFDEANEPLQSFDNLMELGFDRVLTSGQQTTASTGTQLIRELVQRSDNRIIVLAGAGVTPDNAAGIVSETGVQEIHGTFAAVEAGTKRTKSDLVAAARTALSAFPGRASNGSA